VQINLTFPRNDITFFLKGIPPIYRVWFGGTEQQHFVLPENGFNFLPRHG
jgi:hypothetical protein